MPSPFRLGGRPPQFSPETLGLFLIPYAGLPVLLQTDTESAPLERRSKDLNRILHKSGLARAASFLVDSANAGGPIVSSVEESAMGFLHQDPSMDSADAIFSCGGSQWQLTFRRHVLDLPLPPKAIYATDRNPDGSPNFHGFHVVEARLLDPTERVSPEPVLDRSLFSTSLPSPKRFWSR